MFVISVNLFRRHLSDYKKVELARPLERLVARQAEENMKSGVTLPSNEDKVITDEVVAKQIGVSRGTYERAKKIRDSQNSEIQGKVRRGELSISAGYNKLLPPKPPNPKPVKLKPELFLGCLCSQCELLAECVEGSS